MQKLVICFLMVMAFGVSGCAEARNQLGLDRHSPDEFTVVKRAPLTLPPEYNLRPPSDMTAAEDRQQTAGNRARATVFGGDASASKTDSSADDLFLSKAGVAEADPAIRDQLDRERGYVPLKDRSTVDRILRREPEAKGSVIDARAEAARLQQNSTAAEDTETAD